MMRWKSLFSLLVCLCLSGCFAAVGFIAGTAAGVGGYKYYQGKLTVVYQSPFMETWDATLRALEHMNFPVESKDHDLTGGKIAAKKADDTPVRLKLEYKASQETEVGIRVGLFGDQKASVVIKEEIRKQLFKE